MPIKSLKPQLTKFRPIGDRLVVQRVAAEKIADGIIIPEIHVMTGLIRAKVLLVGTKVSDHLGITEGAVVHIPPQLGYMKFILNGENVDIVPTEQVYAVEAA